MHNTIQSLVPTNTFSLALYHSSKGCPKTRHGKTNELKFQVANPTLLFIYMPYRRKCKHFHPICIVSYLSLSGNLKGAYT